jgi:hypothetical protein
MLMLFILGHSTGTHIWGWPYLNSVERYIEFENGQPTQTASYRRNRWKLKIKKDVQTMKYMYILQVQFDWAGVRAVMEMQIYVHVA